MEWNQRFLVLRPSAAKVFAITWQKNVAELLKVRGFDPADATPVLREAFEVTVARSSSLPVRDDAYRMITLHCAVMLLANYHPHGRHIDKDLRPFGGDRVLSRYLKVLRRHGLEMMFHE